MAAESLVLGWSFVMRREGCSLLSIKLYPCITPLNERSFLLWSKVYSLLGRWIFPMLYSNLMLPSPQWWYNGTSDPRHSAREVFFFLLLFPTREKGLQQDCPWASPICQMWSCFQSLEGCYPTFLSSLDSIRPRMTLLAFGIRCTSFLVLMKYKFLLQKKI